MTVQVVRKNIKNLHLGVYPPGGRVRVAVPLHVDDDAVRLAVISRLSWIRTRQAGFEKQDRQSERELVSGESHYVLGKRYRLRVVEQPGRSALRIVGKTTLEFRVPPGSSREERDAILQRWYRELLREQVAELIPRWEPIIGVRVEAWGIKRMKTKWGSCNQVAGRIWLNLELAKKPHSCIEYILVHEMVHLLERSHNERFRALMDGFMPQWGAYRAELNRAPLAHEAWEY